MGVSEIWPVRGQLREPVRGQLRGPVHGRLREPERESGRAAPDPGGRSRETVHVEIDELAFDGFDHRLDTGRVSAAFDAELTRLLGERGVPLVADGVDRELDGLFRLPQLPATTSPDRLGAALARSVHAALSGEGRDRPDRDPRGGR